MTTQMWAEMNDFAFGQLPPEEELGEMSDEKMDEAEELEADENVSARHL